MQRRSLLSAAIGASALSALPLRNARAQAAGFPNKPIRLIVPFTAGLRH